MGRGGQYEEDKINVYIHILKHQSIPTQYLEELN